MTVVRVSRRPPVRRRACTRSPRGRPHFGCRSSSCSLEDGSGPSGAGRSDEPALLSGSDVYYGVRRRATTISTAVFAADDRTRLRPRNSASCTRSSPVRRVPSSPAPGGGSRLRLPHLATAVGGHVVDYFRWRNEDAHRNALNAHGYWLAPQSGEVGRRGDDGDGRAVLGGEERTRSSSTGSISTTCRCGRSEGGIVLGGVRPPGREPDPASGVRSRRRVKHDLELPMKDDYSAFILALLARVERHPA